MSFHHCIRLAKIIYGLATGKLKTKEACIELEKLLWEMVDILSYGKQLTDKIRAALRTGKCKWVTTEDDDE